MMLQSKSGGLCLRHVDEYVQTWHSGVLMLSNGCFRVPFETKRSGEFDYLKREGCRRGLRAQAPRMI